MAKLSCRDMSLRFSYAFFKYFSVGSVGCLITVLAFLIFDNISWWDDINGYLGFDFIMTLIVIGSCMLAFIVIVGIATLVKEHVMFHPVNIITLPCLGAFFFTIILVAIQYDPHFFNNFFWMNVENDGLITMRFWIFSGIFTAVVALTVYCFTKVVLGTRGILDWSRTTIDAKQIRLYTVSTLISAFFGFGGFFLFAFNFINVSTYWERLGLILSRYIGSASLILMILVIPVIFWVLRYVVFRNARIQARKALSIVFVVSLFTSPVAALVPLGLIIDAQLANAASGASSFVIGIFFFAYLVQVIILVPASVSKDEFLAGKIQRIKDKMRRFIMRHPARQPSAIPVTHQSRYPVTSLLLLLIVASFATVFFAPFFTDAPPSDAPATTTLKTLNGIQIPFQNDMVYPSFETQPNKTQGGSRLVIPLEGSWRFAIFPETSDISFRIRTNEVLREMGGAFVDPAYDDSSWSLLHVPSSFNQPETTVDAYRNFQGITWYRRQITVPDVSSISARPRFILKMLGANYMTDVWIDGNHVGYHEGGFSCFAFDVTQYIGGSGAPGNHTIAIRVDTLGYNSPYKPLGIPSGMHDWFNYGGIIRDLFLEVVPDAHVARLNVRTLSQTRVDDRNGTIFCNLEAIVRCPAQGTAGSSSQQLSVAIHRLCFDTTEELMDVRTWQFITADAGLNVIGDTSASIPATGIDGTGYAAYRFQLELDHVAFWCTDRPALYAIEVNLTCNGETDRFYTQTGFKEFRVDGTALQLNGQDLFLNGVSYHEQSSTNGRTLSTQEIFTDLLLMKAMNVNFDRGHYPQHPFHYLFSDRLGIAIWEEIPVYWSGDSGFITMKNRGTAKSMFVEMVFRDLNRPSILFWSAANEPWSRYMLETYLKDMRTFQETIDPTRVLIFASHSGDANNQGHSKLQVIGQNMYWGVFNGEWGNYYAQTRAVLNDLITINPGKPVLVPEYGVWGETDQIKCFVNTTRAFLERDEVVGMTWWTAFDYWGGSSSGSPGYYYNGMGVYNMDRTGRRPFGTYMRALHGTLASKYITPTGSDGYIKNWLVVGGFNNTINATNVSTELGNHVNMTREFCPGDNATAEAPPIPGSDPNKVWIPYQGMTSYIDLWDCGFDLNQDSAAYAMTYVYFPENISDAYFFVGSDDGCRVFYDGNPIYYNHTYQGITLDQYRLPVGSITAGRHRLGVMVENGDGDWRFSFRVSSTNASFTRIPGLEYKISPDS